MNLNSYKVAIDLKNKFKDEAHFVKVTESAKKGTIGKIVDVRNIYYSSHDYKIQVANKRPFWINGKSLEYLEEYKGETTYKNEITTPDHYDMMGRVIAVGQVIAFPRSGERSKISMVIGTVKSISKTGCVYVKVFKDSGLTMPNEEPVRMGTPSRSIIIDGSTVDQVLLAKLSN